MKILLVSDIHSDYSAAESVYHEEKPYFVLDCGDHAEIKNLFELRFFIIDFLKTFKKAVSISFGATSDPPKDIMIFSLAIQKFYHKIP